MVFFIMAVVFVLSANFIRVYRQAMFIEVYERPDIKILSYTLAAGFAFNFVLPLKSGDIIRGFIAGKKMKNGCGLALASVIMDRCLDIIVVGFVFFVLRFTGIKDAGQYTLHYFFAALILLGFLIMCAVFRKYVKMIIKSIAGLFNSRIELMIMRFAWALIWGFKDIVKKISKVKLIASTVLMWTLYILSCEFLSFFLNTISDYGSWVDVFLSLFSTESVISGSINITFGMLWNTLYYILPAVLLFICSPLLKKIIFFGEKQYLSLIPQVRSEDKIAFLRLYFSGENKHYINNYLEINREIMVLRDCSAGSNATTILCNNGKENFYRKYAFDKDAEKLYYQIKWIEENNDKLPLTKILRCGKNDDYCYYDMPFYDNAVGLFDYIHSNDPERAWFFISSALETFQNSIYQKDKIPADKDTIEKYIDRKVIDNLNIIENARALKKLMKYDYLIINGEKYDNITNLKKFINKKHLSEVFKNDTYTSIHGDLTIENIICKKNQNGDGFYIIDPNGGNIHESPFLDYAKLLQSLHGNYEFLMTAKDVSVYDNCIDFIFFKSAAYNYLIKKLDLYMEKYLTKEEIKSVYYHEIVNWLRLMPYKIVKNDTQAVIFFAGLVIVLNDVIKRFEREVL